MQQKTRKVLRRIGVTLLWAGVLTGFVILLVAAVHDKNDGKCTGIVVKLQGEDDANFFIEEKDIKSLVARDKATNPVGKAIKDINTANLEQIVSRDPWVKKAEIFIDNQRKLNIKVTQREPLARVFTTNGNSFYFDRDGDRIPVSTRYAARVPVFTGFPTDADKLQSADSLVAAGIMALGSFIQEDPFWSAQIEQITVTPGREFELIPKLGDHIIVFGDGHDVEKKFSKLLAFYKEGLNKVGWNNYAKINVAYDNEVVCTRRTGEELSKKLAVEDSARIARLSDSSDRSRIHQDEVKQAVTTPGKKTPVRVVTARPSLSKAKESKAAAADKTTPKAVYKPGKKSVNTTKNNRTP
ncbi:cell division protein FtsQ/DivIB [Chitinophaga rhizophila]|uniref:Cell division protein FtsQ n=1 Tax=Chitinophaga rhizophila TaxID=2866212 RepID=A0ABS7GG58_9BACT|nr:hypothetical protein [Chitinophaga rhizophila]MBW8685483.1 hypothetical protein [Chitinophaga rhizophila]